MRQDLLDKTAPNHPHPILPSNQRPRIRVKYFLPDQPTRFSTSPPRPAFSLLISHLAVPPPTHHHQGIPNLRPHY
jgi:hypothetical protein